MAAEDHQILEFNKYKIEISVRHGIVKHKLTQLIRPKIITTAKKPPALLQNSALKLKSALKRALKKLDFGSKNILKTQRSHT